jgi:hypothetical protein
MKKVTKKFKTLLINVSDDLEKIIKQKNINQLIPATLISQALTTLEEIKELQSKSLATDEENTSLAQT